MTDINSTNDCSVKEKSMRPMIIWLSVIAVVVLALMAFLFCGSPEEAGPSKAELNYILPQPSGSGPAVDHQALITDTSEDVMARGEKVYQSCVPCHGAQGEGSEVIVNARKFISEVFVNNIHGEKADPYSMYDSISNGFNNGAMPPQAHLSSSDRYAVIHYIRENFVKTKNQSQYVTIDEAYFAAKTFTVGAPVKKRIGPHPATLEVTIPVYALLAQTSAKTDKAVAASELWLQSLDGSRYPQRLYSSIVALRSYAGTEFGKDVYDCIRSGSAKQLQGALLRPEVSAMTSVFNSLSVDDFTQLYASLQSDSKR